MTEQECLDQMVAPGTRRPGKWRDGVIQIHITRACDKACFACTQGSNLGGKTEFMSPEHFEQAVRSLGFSEKYNALDRGEAYFGVVGVFGGNPAMSPHFKDYCEVLKAYVPFEQRGLWCNNPITLGKAEEMSRTFNPAVSNLNCHMDEQAYKMFKQGWPGCHVVGLDRDSRHAPVHLAMKDVLREKCGRCWGEPTSDGEPCPDCEGIGTFPDNNRIWELISGCDINQHWSAMIGVFRGQLRAWFCEVAGAQAMLHQGEEGYPDTGMPVDGSGMHYYDIVKSPLGYAPKRIDQWWQLSMNAFKSQVEKHCHECGVPLRGYGELSQANDTHKEQTSATHADIFKPKRKGRPVEIVTELVQLNVGRIEKVNHYLQNSYR